MLFLFQDQKYKAEFRGDIQKHLYIQKQNQWFQQKEWSLWSFFALLILSMKVIRSYKRSSWIPEEKWENVHETRTPYFSPTLFPNRRDIKSHIQINDPNLTQLNKNQVSLSFFCFFRNWATQTLFRPEFKKFEFRNFNSTIDKIKKNSDQVTSRDFIFRFSNSVSKTWNLMIKSKFRNTNF